MPGAPGKTRLTDRFSEMLTRLDDSPSCGGSLVSVEVPLRICPLGAHVDHQGGVVTGMTVDRSVLITAQPVDEPRIEIESLDFPDKVVVDLTREPAAASGDWGDYVRASVASFRAEFSPRHGYRAVIGGPMVGMGLSSSSAVLIAYLVLLARVNRLELVPERLAALVQRAENSYIGVASGLLDPSIMIHSEHGKLTTIDCLDGAVERIAGPSHAPRIAVLAAFSGATRRLQDSKFNDRVSECGLAAAALLDHAGLPRDPEPRLRQVDPEVFSTHGHRLPGRLRRRAMHFFGEMERVAEGARVWAEGDLSRFGELVTASGKSSIVNYECGTSPLISLFELLGRQPGVLGTRFSGAGFGGSCIALADPDACPDIVEAVERQFAEIEPELASRAWVDVCRTAGRYRVFRGSP